MASNSFGTHFRITTWGESHGPAIGVVIDGCPAGIPITAEEIDVELARRAPGRQPWTSPRREPDTCEILSGVYEGETTGVPISLLIRNQDARSESYAPISQLLRPGHANFTYLKKYGRFDPRGGGRASARETACRVAAGALAKKLLAASDIHCTARLLSAGGVSTDDPARFADFMQSVVDAGDSVGGVVEVLAEGLPVGLGDPVYEKLEARLAHALLSLPASKGFEIGEGFAAAAMRGSEHNDGFCSLNGEVGCASNHAGGTLGGISTGMPLLVRVAFKPTSSIRLPQQTTDLQGNDAVLNLPAGSRHDPCVAIRAVPVAEAMVALVVADALLASKISAPLMCDYDLSHQ